MISNDLDFQRSNRLPGEQYTPDIQCQLALGSQYKAYHSTKEPFNVSSHEYERLVINSHDTHQQDICRELWCLSGSWATPAHPALEGSACGTRGQKCFQGTCSNDQQTSATKRRSVPSNQVASTANRNNNNNQYNQMRRPAPIRFGFGSFGPFPFPGRRRGMSEDDPTAIPVEEKIGSTPATAAELTSTRESEKPFLYHFKGLIRSILPEANSFFNLFPFRSR